MVEKLVAAGSPSGLEAGPETMLMQVANRYENKIYLRAETKRANAKSVMGMMMLCLTVGKATMVEAEGADEELAVSGIEKCLKDQE